MSEKYENVLNLTTIQLANFLAVRRLNTSGRKVKWFARAFAALELKLDIIESSEQQLEKLNREYTELLRKLEITDPNEIDGPKRIDDLTKWLVGSIGNTYLSLFWRIKNSIWFK